MQVDHILDRLIIRGGVSSGLSSMQFSLCTLGSNKFFHWSILVKRFGAVKTYSIGQTAVHRSGGSQTSDVKRLLSFSSKMV